MGLIDQVTALWRRIVPQRETTTTDERRSPTRPVVDMKRFRAETARAQVVKTCRKMYATDTRAKRHIQTLATDLVGGGFTVQVVEGDRAQEAEEAARGLQERLDMGARLDDWVRLSVRDGDSFLEVGVNERMEIVDVTRKPTLEVRRNSDENDRFPDPTRAFWWASQLWWGAEAPSDAVWFAEWQMMHVRWDHDEGSRYGTPMFASGTGAWKRVKEGDVDIAVRRKTRAGMKYLHVVEGADGTDLKAYKSENKDALDNPFAAVADFFSNRKGSITAIQGDARLDQIGDVEYQIQTWLMASPVPVELLGYGQNLNRDVLDEKKKQYDETLEQLRPWVEREIVKPLVELQWLLMGIWPRGLKYSIQWTEKRLISAEDVRNIADATLKLKALGLPDEVIWQVLGRFLPGVDLNALMGDSDEREGSVDVMAQSLDRLRGMF